MRCAAIRAVANPPTATQTANAARVWNARHHPPEALWCAPGCDPRRRGDHVCDLACRNRACAICAQCSAWLPPAVLTPTPPCASLQRRVARTTETALGVRMALVVTRTSVSRVSTLV